MKFDPKMTDTTFQTAEGREAGALVKSDNDDGVGDLHSRGDKLGVMDGRERSGSGLLLFSTHGFDTNLPPSCVAVGAALALNASRHPTHHRQHCKTIRHKRGEGGGGGQGEGEGGPTDAPPPPSSFSPACLYTNKHADTWGCVELRERGGKKEGGGALPPQHTKWLLMSLQMQAN